MIKYFTYSKDGYLIEMRRADKREKAHGMADWITVRPEEDRIPKIPGLYQSIPLKNERSRITIDISAKKVV